MEVLPLGFYRVALMSEGRGVNHTCGKVTTLIKTEVF